MNSKISPSVAAAAAGAGDSSSRHFLLRLCALSLVMGLSIGYTRVITALLAVQMNAHGWMLAVVALSQSIGMLVLAAPAGRWVHTHGARPTFVIASAWGALVCLLIPVMPTFTALVLLTAAASLAMPPRFVAINTIFMSRLEQVGRQRAGWFRAAHVIGMTFLGAVLATTLFSRYGSLLAFWLAAAIFGLNIVVFLAGVGRDARKRAPARPGEAHGEGALLRLLALPAARRVALWEFSIQSLNAYFAFYIVIIVLRYLHLPEKVAGVAVAVQGLAFVGTLLAAGTLVLRYPALSRRTGSALVLGAMVGLATSDGAAQIYISSALLGLGLGLLQIMNLTEFAALGEAIGFSRAASINALSGPSGGVVGGLLGGLMEPWATPQGLFLGFIPLFVWLAFALRIEAVSAGHRTH